MRGKSRLTVVSLIATKGGAGKTTLTTALAVLAARESKKVAMLGIDPQDSLHSWWSRRRNKGNPTLLEVEAVPEAIQLLRDGWEWLFIDGPPAKMEYIEPVIALSDFVVIPVLPSYHDVEQVALVTDFCTEHKKPAAIVLNQAPPTWATTKQARAFLGKTYPNVPLLGEGINTRQAWRQAVNTGQTGPEVEADGKAGEELEKVWGDLKKAIRQKVR